MTHRRDIIAAIGALGLLLGGCGGSSHPTASTTATQGSSGATTASTHATTQATTRSAAVSAPVPSRHPPAGGPVPKSFDPVAFTAISPIQFWLLGTAPCSRPVCTSIVRTTDGGAHFVGIPAPLAPIESPTTGRGVSTLLFADPLDGFAGGAGFPEPRQLWVTHDGGAHWRRDRGDVIAFTVTSGHIYAITGTCTKGICSQLRLARAPAAAERWTSVALPVLSAQGLPSLTASGTSVWVSLTPTTATSGKQTLLVSRDGGLTLTPKASPCYSGLTGRMQASSATVVWAACPTGMEAGAWRTADGGSHWSQIPGHPLPGLNGGLPNSLQLAPASDTVAVLVPGGNERLLRSTDAGRTFAPLPFPPKSQSVAWIGFTDPRTGSALVSGSGPPVGPDRLGRETLWRSPDGGVRWRAVRIAAG